MGQYGGGTRNAQRQRVVHPGAACLPSRCHPAVAARSRRSCRLGGVRGQPVLPLHPPPVLPVLPAGNGCIPHLLKAIVQRSGCVACLYCPFTLHMYCLYCPQAMAGSRARSRQSCRGAAARPMCTRCSVSPRSCQGLDPSGRPAGPLELLGRGRGLLHTALFRHRPCLGTTPF